MGKTGRTKPAAKKSPLDRYVTMLEAIASAPESTLSELAQLCHLPFSSAHRVLHTLIRSRLVVLADGKRGEYALGPRLLRLLHSGVDEAWLHIKGQQTIDALAEQLDDTCFINKLIGKDVVTVAWAAPDHQARGFLVPGITQPLHASASAKAIIAYQSIAFVRKIMPERLPKLCSQTKTKLKDVIADLEQVRAQGFATCWNEYEQGVGAIACPVMLPGTDVIYSVGVTGLMDRLSRQPIEKYTSLIRAAADSIARALAHRHERGPELRSLVRPVFPTTRPHVGRAGTRPGNVQPPLRSRAAR
jgi:DNA-binding IclR family transcriptional regulator